MTTAIEWTDETWNPVTGCTKVSAGCDHCYAATLAERRLHDVYTARLPVVDTPENREDPFAVRLWPERLDRPLRWRKPRRVFVNSMSDLFHKDIPDEYVDRVFAVMALAPKHTFQVLTKRPARAARYLGDDSREDEIWSVCSELVGKKQYDDIMVWPLPNVWIGTSVESQDVDYRIRQLLDVPAVVRFLSCEPLIAPLDLTAIRTRAGIVLDALRGEGENEAMWTDRVRDAAFRTSRLDWIIVGGESGPDHRPMKPEWVRDIRDQCQRAGVPFFFKQWGGRTPKAGGRTLDGRTWDEMPDDTDARRRRAAGEDG